MNRPTSSRFLFEFFLCLTFAAVLALAHAGAQDSSAAGKKKTQIEDRPPAGLSLASPIKKTDALMHASKTEPVQPDAIKPLLPDRLDTFSLDAFDGQVLDVGPAKVSQVEALYSDSGGRQLSVSVYDPAGLPPMVGLGLFPQLPAGAQESTTTLTYEGMSVGDYQATLEWYNAAPARKRLQVMTGPRLRLTLSSSQMETAEMSELAQEVDLAALVALAPNAPPPAPAQ